MEERVKLDKHGYAESILDFHNEYTCWLCNCNGSNQGGMDRHEIFGGAFREKSKRLGLWVHLCHEDCHLAIIHGMPGCSDAKLLKSAGQRQAMQKYGWSEADFIREFGKSYL